MRERERGLLAREILSGLTDKQLKEVAGGNGRVRPTSSTSVSVRCKTGEPEDIVMFGAWHADGKISKIENPIQSWCTYRIGFPEQIDQEEFLGWVKRHNFVVEG